MAKKQSNQELVNTWKDRYSTAVNNQQKLFEKFSQWYDLFYAGMATKDIAPWRSKVFIPIMSSKGWNLIAKFVGLKPGFEVTLRNPDVDDEELRMRAEKAQLKLEYDYDNPHLDETVRDKLVSPLLDAVVTGTGLAKVQWCTEKETSYYRDEEAGLMPNGQGGYNVDLKSQKKKTTEKGYNDLIPVNIFNVFVAPTAYNLQKAPWLIIKEFKTIDELKESNVYENIDKLVGQRSLTDEFSQYKQSRNRLLVDQDRIAADDTLDHVAVYECYEKGKILTFAEAGTTGEETIWIKIREQNNYYWHEKYPLVQFKIKQRPYEFWGEGIFEVSHRLQSAINDVFNHYMDNWNLADGMLMVEESSNVNNFSIMPGGQVTYRGTPPTPLKFPEPNPAALRNAMQIIEKAIEDVTVSNYATGAPNSSTDQTRGTATGIMRLQEAAGDLIAFMKTNFQQSVHQIGEFFLSNNQQFLDRPVTLEGIDKTKNITVAPYELQGEADLRIDDASMTPTTKEEKRNSNVEFVKQALAFKQASEAQAAATGIPPLVLNFNKMFQDLGEDFGKRSNKYLVPPEEVRKSMAQLPPKDDTKEYLNMNYKDLPPDIQAQAEAKVGFQPSSLHRPLANTAMSAMQAAQEQPQDAQQMVGGFNG